MQNQSNKTGSMDAKKSEIARLLVQVILSKHSVLTGKKEEVEN